MQRVYGAWANDVHKTRQWTAANAKHLKKTRPPPESRKDKPSDRVFHALADPTRRAIFEFLFGDTEQTVSAITARLGIFPAGR
jgi:hypothetical protein